MKSPDEIACAIIDDLWQKDEACTREYAQEKIAEAIREERERCASIADKAFGRAKASGLKHTEDSASRDRCFARAREANLIARCIRGDMSPLRGHPLEYLED